MSPSSPGPAHWLEQASLFIRANLSRPLRLREVAAAVGRSPERLRRAFLRHTGERFRQHLLRLRIERARSLLATGSLPVRDVGAAVGIPRPECFSRAFRRLSGISPRDYRDRNRTAVASPRGDESSPPDRLLAAFAFEPSHLASSWIVERGEWTVREGTLVGTAPGALLARLATDLPSDFALRLSARRLRSATPSHPIEITLGPEVHETQAGCYVYLGDERNGSHTLERGHFVVARTPGELTFDAWHEIVITCRDNEYAVQLDGSVVLRFVDLVPLSSRNRCRLYLGGWNTTLQIRRLELSSLRPPVGSNPLRTADDLLSENRAEKALEIYHEQLSRMTDTPGEPDLHLKIGTCYRALGLAIRARGHFERFARERPGTIWAMIASVAALESQWDELSEDALRDRVRALVGATTPTLGLQVVLTSLIEAARAAELRGDVERAIAFSRLALANADPGSREAVPAARSLCHQLFVLGRYAEISSLLGGEEFLSKMRPTDRATFRPALALSFAAVGRFREASGVLANTAQTAGRLGLAHQEMHKAIVLQASGRLEEALARYLEFRASFRDAVADRRTAEVNAAQLLALRGDVGRATELVRALRSSAPETGDMLATTARWTVWAIRGSHDRIVSEITDRLAGRPVHGADTLEESLLLGILHELGGDERRAMRSLQALEKSFADGPLWRFALPVACLLGKISEEDLGDRYRGSGLLFDENRSSLFYMLALVARKRGRRAAAKDLFRMAVNTDPLNYWPSILARRELGKLTPEMRRFLGDRHRPGA